MNDMKRPLNSEAFLQKYRILEGLLEKRYDGEKLSGPSVVMEYIRDEDSEPVRVDLDLLREIRNILSHNAGYDGAAVVEPSDEMLERLERIIAYVQQPRLAAQFGTPAERILSAHPNDEVYSVMRNMLNNGYSHVPVRDRSGVIGVFSVKSLFDYLARNGLDVLPQNARIDDLGEHIRCDRDTGERYMFVPADTSIIAVRRAFQRHTERNRRLSVVFVTPNGLQQEDLICMLTPWDVLSDFPIMKETHHGRD